MLYTVLLAVFVFIATVGLGALCYGLLRHVAKTGNKGERYILLSVNENESSDSPPEELIKLLERYNNIKFVQLGDMPDIMSCLWDR